MLPISFFSLKIFYCHHFQIYYYYCFHDGVYILKAKATTWGGGGRGELPLLCTCYYTQLIAVGKRNLVEGDVVCAKW